MQHELNWLELSECLGARSNLFLQLLNAFGSPEAIFAADAARIKEAAPYITAGMLASIEKRRFAKRAKEIFSFCHGIANIRVYPYDHPSYPAAFRTLSDPPVVIYCKGNLPDLENRAKVAVVGPREPDEYGEEVAYKIAFELSAAGVVIVSGMADGIDGVATAAAIAAGGSTVSVFGCGLDRVYPPHHGKLKAECLEGGAVISEYPPGTPPNGHNFPVRNRLISALSDAVLVAQAPEKSGSLITARYALLQGKPLFAVPGDITKNRSAGSNLLLQDGAQVALGGMDILDSLMPRYYQTLSPSTLKEAQQHAYPTPEMFRRFGLHSVEDKKRFAAERQESVRHAIREAKIEADRRKEEPINAGGTSLLTPQQREIYDKIPDGPFTVDALSSKGVPIAEAISALCVFEIYGLLGHLPGGFYEKK